ncbi:LysR family transcriptional regulator [Oscillibacter sp.]|uniref:LysR family transcriptional regulator n=1 Tax=Oscillibacter sp. TaxID=1945593 RepID=UPI00289BD2BE|nr:LysR family transcriptional regulator [Oscillibacter sp.]
MSIRKYIAYLRTIETGSITQAANDLGYTQSAVSKMIADLEDLWQVTLLTRNRSGIEITSEGQNLLPKLQEIVRNYKDLNFAVSEIHGVHSGLLRVGCFTSLSTSVLPSVLRLFHEKYPNIQIQLFTGEYSNVSEWLRRGMIDCGFLTMPASGEFEATYLFQDSLVAVLPPEHPMVNEPCFPVSRLPEESFVNLKEVQDYEITRFLDHLRTSPKTIYEVTSDFALLSMVECGLGMSIVHDLILRPNRYNIVRLPMDITQFREVGIALKRDVTPSAVTSLFLEHVVFCMKKSAFLAGMN